MNNKKPRLPRIEGLDQFDYNDGEIILKKSKYITNPIGEFFVEFSLLEHTINLNLADFIQDRFHDPGYTILKEMTFEQKVATLKNLLAQYIHLYEPNPKTTAKFKDTFKEIIEAMEFRNKLAHANWYTLQNDYYVRVKIEANKANGYVGFKMENMSPAIIRQMTKKVARAAEKLDEFIENAQEEFEQSAHEAQGNHT